jgi:hypothetical protein
MAKYKKEVDQYNEKAMYDYADKFINIANEMAKLDNSGAVGVALRFAAARYCAFEASLQTNKLIEERSKHLRHYSDVFNKMLQRNLDDYIMIQLQQIHSEKNS